jgi:hypothetical protein
MSDTPTFQFDVAKPEMQRLYDENNFDAALAHCVESEVPAPNAGTRELLMHEGFCCKKRTVRYCDKDTGDELALVSYVTPAPGVPWGPYRIISRLRVGDVVYEATVQNS